MQKVFYENKTMSSRYAELRDDATHVVSETEAFEHYFVARGQAKLVRGVTSQIRGLRERLNNWFIPASEQIATIEAVLDFLDKVAADLKEQYMSKLDANADEWDVFAVYEDTLYDTRQKVGDFKRYIVENK